MHDFRKLVSTGRSQIRADQEIVIELACHLEEMYTDLRRLGVPEEEAMLQVTALGKKLGRIVRRLHWQNEGGWENWFRAVAIPGIILMLLYGVCKALLVDFYWERAFSIREAFTVLICMVIGFHASSLSRKLGGRASQRRWAAMLIVAPYAIVWCVMALLVTPLQIVQAAHYRPWTISEAAVPLLWVMLWDLVIPAAGLAVGEVISELASPTSSSLPNIEIA
jgi:hypothetical protein